VDITYKPPPVLSVCPGLLGLERGLERAIGKIRVVTYVEIESFIIANLLTGMEAGMVDPAPIWTNAETFNAQPLRGRIEGIIGGYPCPGESLAGLREGHLYEGFIWPSIRRSIAAARPLWCFFENVDDHLTGTYPIVQRSLRNMGYSVEAGVYTAEEVGATHERKRLFILAMADCISERLERWSKQPAWQEFTATQRSGEIMAYAIRHNGKKVQIKKGQPGVRQEPVSDGYPWGNERFTAGQGYFQYPWEKPRTVKPGVGESIHGYKYREDLLRALGNMVVEQQAELAFNDLLNKHLKIKK
jgi:site-specific DNA-cytosine methylase